MSRADNFQAEGTIVKLERGFYRVELTNGAEILCTLCGKMRINRIRVVPGDRVTVRISPAGLDRGIITFRFKN